MKSNYFIRIDENGFALGRVVDRSGSMAKDVNCVSCSEHPLPDDFLRAKWDGRKWVEAAGRTERGHHLDGVKKEKIVQMRRECECACLIIASRDAQRNWILDGLTSDAKIKKKIKKLQEHRKHSNELEARINKIKTLKLLNEIEIKFE